jgi:serine/threonine protein kinase
VCINDGAQRVYMKEQHGNIQEQSDAQANDARARHPSRIGNYELIRRIDVGGMGEVYLARQLTAFEREVAIKIMRSDLVHDPLARKRFLHEAEVSAHLLHEHILTLIEFSEEDGRLFLVTPYIKGGTLAQRLRREPLTLGEVYQLFKALVLAVAYIHKHGVIHRDLKPSNVLLDRDDASGEVYVRLIDFGIASSHKRNSEALTLPGLALGTAAYMAPERLNDITAPSNDIYSLGVILYEMVTGNLPSMSGRIIALPQPLNAIVRCCMAVNPEERYQSAEELLTAFEEAYKVMSNKIPQVRKPSPSSPGLPQPTPSAPEQPQVRKSSPSSPGQPPQEKKSTTSGHVAAVKASQSGTLNEVLVHRGEFVLSPLPGQGSTFQREDYEAPTTYIEPASVTSSQASLADAAVLPSQPLKSRKKLSGTFFGVVTVVVIAMLVVVGGMGYTVFQASISASVVITPRVQTISHVLALTANPNLHTVDTASSSLPAITLNSSQTSSQTGQTTVNKAFCFLGFGICQPTVNVQDIEAPLQQAKTAAQTKVQQALQQQAQANQCTTVGDVSYSDGGLSFNPPPGTVSNTVTVSLTEQGSVECIKTQDVQSLAHTLLQRQVPQNYALLDQTIKIGQFTVNNVDTNGVIKLSVPVAAVTSYQITDQELTTIQKHISGMTPAAAKAYIATMPGVDASSISIRLTFGSTIPTNAQQIHISQTNPTNLAAVQLPKTA